MDSSKQSSETGEWSLENPVYCVYCRRQIDPHAVICPFCQKEQKPQKTQQPPTQEALPPSTSANAQNSYVPPTTQLQPPPVQPPHDIELLELARQYKAANMGRIWSFIAGIFCLWPLLIITYIESNKIKDIKARVAAKGIDPEVWVRYI